MKTGIADIQIISAPSVPGLRSGGVELLGQRLLENGLAALTGAKSTGNYGLIFIHAHADFYEPEKSTTGEVADMDLAIVTGRGPEILTNIDQLKPYVTDEQVIHLGQRDWEETKKYGSQDIRYSGIKCVSLEEIERRGMVAILNEVIHHTGSIDVEGFWIHFDTHVLNDAIDPAVDYRVPGGLSFEQAEIFVGHQANCGYISD